MNKKKIELLSLSMLLIAGIALFLFLYYQPSLTGTCVKNLDSYLLDAQRMNGTDRHTLTLKAEDSLRIHFKTEAGALRLEIKAPDGTALYSGNGTEATDFTVRIPENGAYALTVEARQAQGTLHVQAQSADE